MDSAIMQMAFAVKQEILRNIVKTHAVILIEGWTGTGKTVTALKAVKGMGEVYYYSGPAGPARNVMQCIGEYKGNLTIVNNPIELRDLKAGKQCVVFDDLDRLGVEGRSILETMIRERGKDRKILVITQVVLDAQDLLQNMDVVVRFKHNTAEMLHSKLQTSIVDTG